VRLVSRDENRPSSNETVFRRRAHHDRRDPLPLSISATAALEKHRGGMPHGAAGMGAAAGAHHIGVAHDDAHAFRRGT